MGIGTDETGRRLDGSRAVITLQLWIGLGNPGAQYALHRHNAGFMAIDTVAAVHGFGPVQKKFSGWLQEGRIGGTKVLLLKPLRPRYPAASWLASRPTCGSTGFWLICGPAPAAIKSS